jgi:branched-chain amino acid transport system ATP-binding protein
MLKLDGIDTFYGSSQVLFNVSLQVNDGEVVTLLGRNGMGKSTTIKSIMGLVDVERGSITFNGKEIQHLPSYQVARQGIGLVPEGRQIFPNLTVRENIMVCAAHYGGRKEPYTLDEVLDIFPRLGERLNNYGNQLSGGEQQMLAVARALMTTPKLLILDEATEGLAPLVRKEIWYGLGVLKNRGQSILVIDKNLNALMQLADRHYVMEKGEVVWSGATEEIIDNDELKARYLGV